MGIATLPTIEAIRNRWAERGQLADGAWHPRHTPPDDPRTNLVADMCARDVAVLLAEVERLRAELAPPECCARVIFWNGATGRWHQRGCPHWPSNLSLP
jgi:hypothetical protein